MKGGKYYKASKHYISQIQSRAKCSPLTTSSQPSAADQFDADLLVAFVGDHNNAHSQVK